MSWYRFMSRTTVIYVLVLLACAAGVYAIIDFGSSMTAPTDLTGIWDVGVDESADKNALGAKMNIEQSGRFVRLNFDGGLKVDLKLVSQHRPAPPEQALQMSFQGSGWKLTAEGAGAEGPLVFHLVGPQEHKLTVTRHVVEVTEANPPVTTETADAATHAP